MLQSEAKYISHMNINYLYIHYFIQNDKNTYQTLPYNLVLLITFVCSHHMISYRFIPNTTFGTSI